MALRVHNPAGGSYVANSRPFTGATANSAGRAGLVPGPAAGQEDQVLYGSGTFGPMTADKIFAADVNNICGDGINAVVTLQRLISTIATKLQERTVFNYTGPSAETSGESSGEDTAAVFQKEYVVDTYGIVGDSGETVTTAQLTSAIADELQNRTAWNYVSDEENENDGTEVVQDNEEVNNSSEPSNEPVQSEPQSEEPSADPVDSGTGEPEEENDGDSLKDQMLNME